MMVQGGVTEQGAGAGTTVVVLQDGSPASTTVRVRSPAAMGKGPKVTACP